VRKLKKFKRYEEGGAVGSGSGDPFSYTDFSNRERNLRKPSEAAPIEERQPPKKAAEEDKAPAKAPAKPAETKPVESGRGKITSTSTMTDEESRADSDKGAAPSSFTTTGNAKKAEEYRQSLMPVSKPKPKPPAPAAEKTPAPAAEKTPAAPAKAPRAARPEDIPGTDVKTPYRGEKIQNSGQFAQSAMAAFPALRGVGAGIRGAMGLGRMFESAPRAEGKGTGKFPEAKPEIEVSTKPAVDRLKEANIQGPPKPPRQETATDKMGVRETSAMERSRKGNEVGPVDSGARARRVAEEAAKDAKQAEGVMAAASSRAAQNRADQKQAADVMAAANKRARDNRADQKQAADVMTAANKRAKDTRAEGKKRADTERAQQRSDKIPQKEREPGYMQEYISGREAARNRARDLSDDGLSTPRYANKKGGKIPAFKKGGLVGRADGCAQRGKTKGRMV
jgi:hypothetical protein